MKYFSYGSNMLLARIRAADRAPSARPLMRARLRGHALRWHKRGRDGSAKCDAWRTDDAGDVVHGVVYEISRPDVRALHDVEGAGRGYAVHEADLINGDRRVRAYLYVAQPGWIDSSLRPYRWYADLVEAGARQHGLPPAYVAALARVQASRDADRSRAAAADRLLARR